MAKTLFPMRCQSQVCSSSLLKANLLHYVESLQAPCPVCTQKTLKKCAIIHLIREFPNGPIKGSEMSGRPQARYDFMCDLAKEGYALPPDHPKQPKHYTLVPAAATCSQCLQAHGATLDGTIMTLPPPTNETQAYN